LNQRFSTLPAKLNSAEALALHLEALLVRDPRLRPVAERAGPFALRDTYAGFAGLARIVTGQQVSVASARAIWERLEALPGALEPEGYLRLEEAAIRAAGFSGAKYHTMRAVAEAAIAGTLDLSAVAELPAAAAAEQLMAIKGIGPWTAELYLMFCAGHPDIFPVGDIALQKAVALGLELPERPMGPDLARIALAWAPHRATAALLFWRYFAAVRGMDGVIL